MYYLKCLQWKFTDKLKTKQYYYSKDVVKSIAIYSYNPALPLVPTCVVIASRC